MNNKPMKMSLKCKILITFISLTEDRITITYEENLEFLTFVNFYVSKLAGTRELKSWSVTNLEKTLFDKMTASNIAYAILVYENGIDVWMERFQNRQMNIEEQCQFVQSAELKYHHPAGMKLAAYHDGWTQLDRDYYYSLLKTIQGIKGNTILWDVMKDNWRTCLNKNKRGSFVHVAGTGIFKYMFSCISNILGSNTTKRGKEAFDKLHQVLASQSTHQSETDFPRPSVRNGITDGSKMGGMERVGNLAILLCVTYTK